MCRYGEQVSLIAALVLTSNVLCYVGAAARSRAPQRRKDIECIDFIAFSEKASSAD
jgi:hypothetical protein